MAFSSLGIPEHHQLFRFSYPQKEILRFRYTPFSQVWMGGMADFLNQCRAVPSLQLAISDLTVRGIRFIPASSKASNPPSCLSRMVMQQTTSRLQRTPLFQITVEMIQKIGALREISPQQKTSTLYQPQERHPVTR